MMYMDRRGKKAPYKVPRKFKKQWRKALVQELERLGCKKKRYRLWYSKQIGWIVEHERESHEMGI